MGDDMNPLLTRTTQEISLLKNKIVHLRGKYKQEADRDKRSILLIQLNSHLHVYQELTKPIAPPQQVG